ncbi:hypothetical protein A2382_02975 [Candidatus Woesebacteria bacterium RIFOXYB1_FULL_38_16]|uniref:Uncharacterized protein n=1 Tax=Candidatus Woesebacteria bacterium RIFOXYB1_FULL_38_16 TaxID=1802538 RepID=A0A1F8CTL2_9BACT|nr:MAG: hypothetical protein A2382_02975 [Candidatus Woesebacteria bacterium RIFOXYB1_FULL_38_16]
MNEHKLPDGSFIILTVTRRLMHFWMVRYWRHQDKTVEVFQSGPADGMLQEIVDKNPEILEGLTVSWDHDQLHAEIMRSIPY